MANNHIVTKDIGNLRGISTDSIFLRPPNVAEIATNIQKAPDGSLQLRRGYQCQIAAIGGMGIGTYDDPTTDKVQTVCVDMDGFLYHKQENQIFLYYDGQITGAIQNITPGMPAIIQSNGHGLINGAEVIIRGASGLTGINSFTFPITVIDANNFSLNGSNVTGTWMGGGIWSIAYADNSYLTFSIFTDPLYIYNNSGQSITCNVQANRAAQVNGIFTNVNVFTVQFGQTLVATDIIQFVTTNGVLQTRNVLSSTTTSITFDGAPASVSDGTYIIQFFNILFGKGFDVVGPYSIQQFITTLTNPVTGVEGLQISINGPTNFPAAFLQIVEPTIIDNNLPFVMNYWWWKKVNSTKSLPLPGSNVVPLPGSASQKYQNSSDFENASVVAYDDVVYIANGIDYPQKYDGQTIYRTGMPIGVRVSNTVNTSAGTYPYGQPFSQNDVYQYATTYEQIDNRIHTVEGEISEINTWTVPTTTSSTNVILTNLLNGPQNNWNTNGAVIGATPTSTIYGPDAAGNYYNNVTVNSGFSFNIGDSAYYADYTGAVMSGAVTDAITLPVNTGHSITPDAIVYFLDSGNVARQRIISSITDNSITIMGTPVTTSVASAKYKNILTYKVSKVYGNVAIVNGNQNNTNTITVLTGYSTQVGDIVTFFDISGNLQRRTVTALNSMAGINITISGIPVSVSDGLLIQSENFSTDGTSINLQRTPVQLEPLIVNSNPIQVTQGNLLSNNLRINIYRTLVNQDFVKANATIYFIASIPNDPSGAALQTYVDALPDVELTIKYERLKDAPNPPPISKYLRAFGTQLFYAGGERGNPIDSDRVFFSEGGLPETVPIASFFLDFPNTDDDVTGLGVAGTTLVVTKNHSLWALAGDPLKGNISVVQIAPGSNIGCVAHASIASIGGLMYFLHTNGLYAITENQLFPTDSFGNPIPISLAIDAVFREQNYLPQTRYVFKRAVGINYSKDEQYLLFLPCEDTQTTIRDANANSAIFCYDYLHKNWFMWNNINAAGGMVVVDDNLHFQERRFSGVNGNTANFYKQHRFYRLVDHADHAGPQYCEWRSSWEDLGQPLVRKKFSKCVLLMDRISDLFQYNNPQMTFKTYLNRIPNAPNTIATVSQVNNSRNASWSLNAWNWSYWGGYQDSFVAVNLKRGTVAKSIQVGLEIQGINMDIRLAGFQLEAIPENRISVIR